MSADGFTVRDTPPAAPPGEKRPLYREAPPAPAFPQDGLGALRPAVEAIQDRTQAPPALCAQSALAAVALAAMPHADVVLPGAGVRPLGCYFVTIAQSGERKSTADGIALAPIRELEERSRETYGEEWRRFCNDKDAYDEARKKALKAGKGDRAATRRALDALGPEPLAPASPMLTVSDATSQALERFLEPRPWAGLFSAEGGMIVGGHAFSDENRMRTGALLNATWDGEPIRRARVGTGEAFLKGRRLAMHVMVQSVVAETLLADPLLAGMGLHARLLIADPGSTMGTRMFRDPSIAGGAALADYGARLLALAERRPAFLGAMRDGLQPRELRLSREAERAWVDFHNNAERGLAEGAELESIRPWAAKGAEHAARLAGVLALYADPDTSEIGAEAMAGGIALAAHYAAEMLRLAGTSAASEPLRRAAGLLAWLKGRPGGAVHLATVYQRGPANIRDAKSAREAMTILEDHGHVRRLPKGLILDGSPRADAWELAP